MLITDNEAKLTTTRAQSTKLNWFDCVERILFRTADYSSALCGKFAGWNCRGRGTEGVFPRRTACYSSEQRERRHDWEFWV